MTRTASKARKGVTEVSGDMPAHGAVIDIPLGKLIATDRAFMRGRGRR